MVELDVVEELKPDNSVLKVISESKPTMLRISNGKVNQIKKTNIKSIEPIIYELTFKDETLIIWQYPINELEGNIQNKVLIFVLVIIFLRIKYNHKIYKVAIIKSEDERYWYLKPYNKSYYTTNARDYNSFELVIYAIKENNILFDKK